MASLALSKSNKIHLPVTQKLIDLHIMSHLFILYKNQSANQHIVVLQEGDYNYFLESLHHCEVARQPVETPGSSRFYTCTFFSLHNV